MGGRGEERQREKGNGLCLQRTVCSSEVWIPGEGLVWLRGQELMRRRKAALGFPHSCANIRRVCFSSHHSNFLSLFFFFCLCRAAPMACEHSQAKGLIGVTATGLYHSSWQHQILHSRPGIEPVSSQRQCWVLNPWSHNGDSNTCFSLRNVPFGPFP